MEILVVDGQGGRIGQQLIKAIVANYPGVEITAIGTNSLATSAMLKGGASQASGHRDRRRPHGGDLPGHGGGGGPGPGQADSHPPEPVRQPGGRCGGDAGGPAAGQRRGRVGQNSAGGMLTALAENAIITPNFRQEAGTADSSPLPPHCTTLWREYQEGIVFQKKSDTFFCV